MWCSEHDLMFARDEFGLEHCPMCCDECRSEAEAIAYDRNITIR